jgi:ABC-2 type transport system permease protein
VKRSLIRIFSIFTLRNKEFYRDKGAMGWTFIFPFLVIIGFGYMFQLGDTAQYKMGVIEGDNIPKSRHLSPIRYSDFETAKKKLEHHQLDIIYYKNTYWIHKTSPTGKLAEDLLNYSLLKNHSTPIKRHTVEGNEIKYIDWLFPGLITLNVMWMALWGVGWVIVRQRKMGILKRFKASPLKPFEYLSAQMLSRLLILAVTGIILFAGGHLIYPFHTSGSYVELFLFYLLGCLSLSSMGLLVAARISSDEFANGLINLFSYPMMFLSEIWFSLEGSPEWVKAAAKLMPLWHMTNGLREIMTEGATLISLAPSLIYLTAVTLVCLAIGSFFFKWVKD